MSEANMGDGLSLLRAVFNEPTDDTVRLVYADSLQEHDQDDRADFIRRQIKSEYESPCRDCSVWSQRDCPVEGCKFGSDDRALSLLLRNAGWVPTKRLCQYIGGGGQGDLSKGAFWRRGFISSVTCRFKDWISVSHSLYWSPEQGIPIPKTAQPLTHVNLLDWPEVRVSHGRYFWFEGFAPATIGDMHAAAAKYGHFRCAADNLFSCYWPGVKCSLPERFPAANVL